MKKLVALAVAGAFVAPVYAADVSVSGEVEMAYVTTSGQTDTASNVENIVVVTATEEIDGFKISGSVVMDQDADESGDINDADGASLSITLPVGLKVSMGDVTGAMDAVGDYTDVSPAHGGFDADGVDQSFLLTLPSMGGFTLYASMSPEGSGFNGTEGDASAISAKYNFGAGEVYVASEEVGAASWTSMGVKYSVGGLMAAYERGTDDNGTAADSTITGFAVTYKVGNFVIGAELQETKTDGTANPNVDETITFIEYNLGKSVDLYIANESNGSGTTTADQTTVGVEFQF